MKLRFRLAAALGVMGTWVGSTRAGILDWIFPKHDVQVIAVTDTTPAGLLRRPATPDKPIYYMAVNAGYRDFGGIIAGDKLPKKDDMLKTIAQVLAKQGYLPASNEHPPALLLIWTWGTLNTDRMPGLNPDDMEGQQVNRNQLLRFMGAYKLGLISKEPGGFQNELFPGLMFRDADQEMISQLATEDLYVAGIGAYDYAAALERKEKVLLWTTKISCPSRGLAMAETLPTMLAIAGPYIGRETAKPVSIKATEHFKPEIKIGDPTLVEFMQKTPVPIVDAPADSAKKIKTPAKKEQKK